MYLVIWLRRAGLLTLWLAGGVFCALVLASFGSDTAAAQDEMAPWMYMPPRGVASLETLPPVPTEGARGAAPASTAVGDPASALSHRDAKAAALVAGVSGSSFERYLRPAHSARSAQFLGLLDRTD
jgi:hypothetical protein